MVRRFYRMAIEQVKIQKEKVSSTRITHEKVQFSQHRVRRVVAEQLFNATSSEIGWFGSLDVMLRSLDNHIM